MKTVGCFNQQQLQCFDFTIDIFVFPELALITEITMQMRGRFSRYSMGRAVTHMKDGHLAGGGSKPHKMSDRQANRTDVLENTFSERWSKHFFSYFSLRVCKIQCKKIIEQKIN